MLPQIIYLALSLLGMGVSLANHGKPRSNENFGIIFISQLIIYGLLWWGGFFNVFVK